MNVYTRRGDDGTTALRTGERVQKTDAHIELVGALDEAQAFLGLARAESSEMPEIGELLAALERDLWILMAEATTSAAQQGDLVAKVTSVDQAMVDALESSIDHFLEKESFAASFAVPG
jgi:cob(I)alamin adenosyltransferase